MLQLLVAVDTLHNVWFRAQWDKIFMTFRMMSMTVKGMKMMTRMMMMRKTMMRMTT